MANQKVVYYNSPVKFLRAGESASAVENPVELYAAAVREENGATVADLTIEENGLVIIVKGAPVNDSHQPGTCHPAGKTVPGTIKLTNGGVAGPGDTGDDGSGDSGSDDDEAETETEAPKRGRGRRRQS